MNFKDLFQKNSKPRANHLHRQESSNSTDYNGIEEDFDTHLATPSPDETYLRNGINGAERRKLKRGKIVISAHCDLHGYTRRQALPVVSDFIKDAQQHGRRYVLVIFGKGRLSEGKRPVIKPAVLSYLKEHPEVVAYTTAHIKDGGTGAAYVVIRSHK